MNVIKLITILVLVSNLSYSQDTLITSTVSGMIDSLNKLPLTTKGSSDFITITLEQANELMNVNLDYLECQENKQQLEIYLQGYRKIFKENDLELVRLRSVRESCIQFINNTEIIQEEYKVTLAANQKSVKRLNRKNKFWKGVAAVLGSGLVASLILN